MCGLYTLLSVIRYLLLWCSACPQMVLNGSTAAWGVREELGMDSFRADITLTADFPAVCREKTEQHFRTISSLIEHTVRTSPSPFTHHPRPSPFRLLWTPLDTPLLQNKRGEMIYNLRFGVKYFPQKVNVVLLTLSKQQWARLQKLNIEE